MSPLAFFYRGHFLLHSIATAVLLSPSIHIQWLPNCWFNFLLHDLDRLEILMPTLGSFIYRLETVQNMFSDSLWLGLLKYFVKVSQSELDLVFICSGQVPVPFCYICIVHSH
jgi:hypothetical protein